MARLATRANVVTDLLNEAIQLPGCPGIIVTRIWAYHWLVKLGYDPKSRGFGSVDYMAFGTRRVLAPLTDLTEPRTARFLALVEKDIAP